MKVGETRAHENCEIWKISHAIWMNYVHWLQFVIKIIQDDRLFFADSVDEWNYRELKYELENLKRFALEAAERLEGYEKERRNRE